MVTNSFREDLFTLLSDVLDPEVPALSIVDLGIVRDAVGSKEEVTVTITPTYSGCPAMAVIEEQIREKLNRSGFRKVTVHTVLSPAWTTDWISDEAKAKLKRYGIAPPRGEARDLVSISPRVSCPFCDSKNTELRSTFGSTACKAMHYCKGCNQPFEHFKEF